MLEHLISDEFDPQVFDVPAQEFTPFEKAGPTEIIDAQAQVSDWLEDLGLGEKVSQEAASSAARNAFAAVTTGASPQTIQNALSNIKAPQAVQHLVGMLTAYDWEFVEQAKNLRGYAVAQILEETKNPNSNIRLKALGMLGKITEVGLFTEKIEVKKIDASTEELEESIRKRLERYLPKVVEVETVQVKENVPESDA